MPFKMHKNIFFSIKFGRFACFACVLIKNSVSEPKIINYLTFNLLQGNMFAGQNESKMLRNSRQREVETALWCLTIFIWVRVFIYVLQGNIFFGCRSRLCPLFFHLHYILNQLIDFDQTCKDTVLGGGEKLIKFC